VQYAFKKDGKGERHGTSAERLLAAQARKNNALPVAVRPPPAPIQFGAQPPIGYQGGPYQGQFAGALAQPPPGFAPQQTIVPQAVQMPMGGMPPAMPMGIQPPPPPTNMPVYNPQGGFPPPPPVFATGMPGMVPPPPPGVSQQQY
jgi:splicing factor 3B subunit 4